MSAFLRHHRHVAPTLAAPEVAIPEQGEDNSAILERMAPAPAASSPAPAGEVTASAMPGWAADLDEEGGGSGETPPAADTARQQAMAAAFDALVPVGLGLELGGSIELAALVKVGVEETIRAVNHGGGWIDVTAGGEKTAGLAGGVGEEALAGEEGFGGKAELGGGIVTNTEQTWRIPWVRLVSLDPRALLALGPAVGRTVVNDVFSKHDTDPYLLSSETTAGLQGTAEAGVEVAAEKLGISVDLACRVGLGIAYDDVAGAGARTGQITLSGEIDALLPVVAHLAETLGVSVDLSAHATEKASIIQPFTETADGQTALGSPILRWEGAGELGGALGGDTRGGVAGVAVEVGAATVIEGKVGLQQQSDLWRRVLAGPVAELVGGIVPLEAEGAMTLTVRADVTDAIAALAGASPAALGEWLATGAVPAGLAPAASALQAALTGAERELAVELTLGRLGVSGGDTVEVGGEIEGEGSASAAVVYEREDVLPDLPTPPTPAEILAYLRGAAPAAGA